MDHRVVLAVPGGPEAVALLETVEVADGHVLGGDVAHLHAADEAAPGAHAETHGRLVTLLLDGAGLEVEDAARVLRLLSGQLLADLLHVLGVDVVEDARAEPLALRLVEDRTHGVGHVDDAARVARHHEQEAVGRLQDEVLELLVREEGRLVGAVGAGVARPCAATQSIALSPPRSHPRPAPGGGTPAPSVSVIGSADLISRSR